MTSTDQTSVIPSHRIWSFDAASRTEAFNSVLRDLDLINGATFPKPGPFSRLLTNLRSQQPTIVKEKALVIPYGTLEQTSVRDPYGPTIVRDCIGNYWKVDTADISRALTNIWDNVGQFPRYIPVHILTTTDAVLLGIGLVDPTASDLASLDSLDPNLFQAPGELLRQNLRPALLQDNSEIVAYWDKLAVDGTELSISTGPLHSLDALPKNASFRGSLVKTPTDLLLANATTAWISPESKALYRPVQALLSMQLGFEAFPPSSQSGRVTL